MGAAASHGQVIAPPSMIDQVKKNALIKLIKEQSGAGKTELLLSPDVYFDGYEEDSCTICANNRVRVSTARFVERIRSIQARADVAEIFVRFYDYSDAEEDQDCWINSDSLYAVTLASLSEVRGWFADFEVSDVWEEPDTSKFAGLPQLPVGFRLVAIWWD
jgi:hypothetical protein